MVYYMITITIWRYKTFMNSVSTLAFCAVLLPGFFCHGRLVAKSILCINSNCAQIRLVIRAIIIQRARQDEFCITNGCDNISMVLVIDVFMSVTKIRWVNLFRNHFNIRGSWLNQVVSRSMGIRLLLHKTDNRWPTITIWPSYPAVYSVFKQIFMLRIFCTLL